MPSIEDRDYRDEDDRDVWAIRNAGDWYLAQDDDGNLLSTVQADQCEDCGSFDENGEPGEAFVLTSRDQGAGGTYRCGCCGREVHARRKRGGQVIW